MLTVCITSFSFQAISTQDVYSRTGHKMWAKLRNQHQKYDASGGLSWTDHQLLRADATTLQLLQALHDTSKASRNDLNGVCLSG